MIRLHSSRLENKAEEWKETIVFVMLISPNSKIGRAIETLFFQAIDYRPHIKSTRVYLCHHVPSHQVPCVSQVLYGRKFCISGLGQMLSRFFLIFQSVLGEWIQLDRHRSFVFFRRALRIILQIRLQ